MTDTLFPIDDVPLAEVRRFPSPYNGLLDVLGLYIDTFDQPTPLVRVTAKAGPVILKPAGWDDTIFSTRYTNRNHDADNYIEWRKHELAQLDPVQGFVLCVASTPEADTPRGPILHLTEDITDLDLFSTGIFLEDVERIERYSTNAAHVLIALQNAQADDLYPTWAEPVTGLTREQLELLVEKHWPEPEPIYQRSES
jgi:hypothetical protein